MASSYLHHPGQYNHRGRTERLWRDFIDEPIRNDPYDGWILEDDFTTVDPGKLQGVALADANKISGRATVNGLSRSSEIFQINGSSLLCVEALFYVPTIIGSGVALGFGAAAVTSPTADDNFVGAVIDAADAEVDFRGDKGGTTKRHDTLFTGEDAKWLKLGVRIQRDELAEVYVNGRLVAPDKTIGNANLPTVPLAMILFSAAAVELDWYVAGCKQELALDF